MKREWGDSDVTESIFLEFGYHQASGPCVKSMHLDRLNYLLQRTLDRMKFTSDILYYAHIKKTQRGLTKLLHAKDERV